MAFAGGSVTFKRFFCLGEGPKRADEDLLQQLTDHAMGADSLVTADKTELGWITGEHILDTRFSFAKNVIGEAVHFALRIDTNKPPADLVRSYQKLNEEAMLEASGREFLTKAERREAREQAKARAEKEAAEGAFRRSKAVPVLWDLQRNEVYLGGTGTSIADPFMLLFRQTFNRSLAPATAGELASRWAVRSGEARAFDDCSPAHFINPPEGAEDRTLSINAEGAGAKDFLGTEWLAWLCYSAGVGSSEVTTPQGQPVAILFQKSLQLQCAFKLTGTTTIVSESPADLPEATVAMAGGKLPVKAGLQLGVHGSAYSLSIRPDAMNFSGVQLPPPEEANPTPRAIFEDRIDHLRTLLDAVDSLYVAFLKKRLSGKWVTTLNAVRAWIAAGESAGTNAGGRAATVAAAS